jgi:hypothetical protein
MVGGIERRSMFLGRKTTPFRYGCNALLHERCLLVPKAFVMTPGWLRHWREIFQEGLRWDDVDARQNFGFYEAIVILDFGLEPIEDMAVLEFFKYTQTPVEVIPCSLDRFRERLHELFR